MDKSRRMQDSRFDFGTTYSSSFVQHPETAYNYQPLPVTHLQKDKRSLGRHLVNQTDLFPRLDSSEPVVKGKLAPVLTKLLQSLKARDPQNSGVLDEEHVTAALKETGVFLSQADLSALLKPAPRVPGGSIDYVTLCDMISGKVVDLPTASALRPPMPESFSYEGDAAFTLTLRARVDNRFFDIPAERMRKIAHHASVLRKYEGDAAKLHDLMVNFLINDLLILAIDRKDFAFRDWLVESGLLSLTTTMNTVSGPFPPEVYDLFDQIVYEGLGVPVALAAVYVPTSECLTLVANTLRQGLTSTTYHRTS